MLGRRIKVLFQGGGSHPWILERRNGVASGIYYRLREDDRFSWKQMLAEVQFCLSSLISGGGFSTYQMVFGSKPGGFGREDKDECLTFAQDFSPSGQFVQQ